MGACARVRACACVCVYVRGWAYVSADVTFRPGGVKLFLITSSSTYNAYISSFHATEHAE